MKTAQFILAQNPEGLFAARRAPGADCRRVYLIGGAIGAGETLEGVCERQGWRVTRGDFLHADIIGGEYKAEWFSGIARPIRAVDGAAVWATKSIIERYEHIHDAAFDVYEQLKGAI